LKPFNIFIRSIGDLNVDTENDEDDEDDDEEEEDDDDDPRIVVPPRGLSMSGMTFFIQTFRVNKSFIKVPLDQSMRSNYEG
jgi:hypothetical protein